MNLLLACLGLYIVSIIMVPERIVNWHVTPKTATMLVLGLLAVVIMSIPGVEHSVVLGTPQVLALVWGLLCLVSCSWSQSPRFSFRAAMVQMSFALWFVFLSSTLDLYDLTSLAICGTVALVMNAGLATWQHFYGDPWIRLPNGDKKYGEFATFGNRNWYAGYVVGSISFPLYLTVEQSYLWLLVLPLVLWTLYIGRSKAALASLSLGLAGVALPFMVKKYQTMRFRLCFIKSAWYLIRERPFLGHGMRMYRREVYRANVKLNEDTKGKFLDKKNYANPKPREVHNDYVGFAVEVGLVGLILFMSVIVAVLIGAATNLSLGTVVLTYGVLAMMVDGLVFYPFRQAGMGIIFWTLLAMVSVATTTAVPVYYTPTILASLIIGLIVCIPLGRTTYAYVMSNYLANKAFVTKDARYIKRAERYDRYNSMLLSAVIPPLMNTDVIAACACSNRIIEHFDGDTIPWSTWTNYGNARLGLGSVMEAKRAYEIATSYLPYYRPALRGIKQCDQILNNGGKIVIDFSPQEKPPDGLQNTNA